jgi:hypothetical protein
MSAEDRADIEDITDRNGAETAKQKARHAATGPSWCAVCLEKRHAA